MLFKKTTFKSEIGSENDEASFSPEKGTFVVVDSSHLQSARVWDVVRARRFFRSRAPSVAWYTAASRATRSHSQPACRGGAGVHARWRYVFPIYHVLPPCLQPLFDVHSLKGSILLVTLTSTVLASLTNISQVRCLRNTSYEHGPKD